MTPSQTDSGKKRTALAGKGRKGDDTVAHLDTGEVVIPKQLAQAPQFRRIMEAMFKANGGDMARYEVGNEANSTNPETGHAEFYSYDDFEDDLKDVGDAVGDAVESSLDLATAGGYSYAKDELRGREGRFYSSTTDPIKEGAERLMPDIPEPPGVNKRAPQRATGPTGQQQARESMMDQRRRAALAGGRSSTILTGPMGVTGDANIRRRTLLGA